jgi:uncharacterized membrane protein YczE
MSKKKAVVVVGLWVIGVIGFLIGLSMQVSFEETTEFLAERDLGKVVCLISIFLIAFGWLLKKFDDI